MAKLPSDSDTIAAIATANGRAGIGVIRLSGNKALAIAQQLTQESLKPRYAKLCLLKNRDHHVLDEAIVLYFKGPNSFTGEDVVELQGHGGPIILQRVLREVVALDARLAEPGEFSMRAFINDKMDLTQAEAVADLIDAASEAAVDNALSSLQGTFKKLINNLVESVIQLRVYVEAAIDFPEEEIDFLSDGKVENDLSTINQRLINIQQQANQGALLQEGLKVVIAGRPNAGKSSLLNALAQQETAIVTDIAGTTRDVLHENIQIDGLPIRVTDTAGIRETDNIVEKMGVERAKTEIEKAQVILVLIDSTAINTGEQLQAELGKEVKALGIDQQAQNKICFVLNKTDLSLITSGKFHDNNAIFGLSAKSGTGLEELKQYLKQQAGFKNIGETGFTARERHLIALSKAKSMIESAHHQLLSANAGELVAEDLRQAQESLSEITGEFSSDDLLGEIFSSFCIGK